MDSLTQLTLGAAVGEALLGRQMGRKAALWGAFLGTFPDLDVFIPMGDPVSDFTYHRSFSHSMFVLALLTPFWVWLIMKLHKNINLSKKSLMLSVYAIFFTHIILDSFTVYGTQIFWPITEYPVSIGSIFIIDPGYTVPLLIGCLLFLIFRKSKLAYQANLFGLIFSTVYLLWSFGVQSYVKQLTVASLKTKNIDHERFLVTPSPFNTFLWRIVVVDQHGYYVSYYSLFDQNSELAFDFNKSSYHLLDELKDHPPVNRLKWFSHGFITVDQVKEKIVISDIRMGIEPTYVFKFAIAEKKDQDLLPITPERMPVKQDMSRLPLIFERIFNPQVRF